jgi:hypothetical protein
LCSEIKTASQSEPGAHRGGEALGEGSLVST